MYRTETCEGIIDHAQKLLANDEGHPGLLRRTSRAEFRSAADAFKQGESALSFCVGDFWRWALSDLNSNTARGLVAEFIVAQALECADNCREEWSAYDLATRNGISIEVKAAAYRQRWTQRKQSNPRFQIGPTRRWDPVTGTFAEKIQRQAELYIFCVLENQTPSPNDPLDLNRWSFYLLNTAELNRKCPDQRSISLTKVISLGAQKHNFSGLKGGLAASRCNPKGTLKA